MSQSIRVVIRKSLAGYIVIFPFKYLLAISLPRHFFSFYSSYQSIFTYFICIMNADFLRINIVSFKCMSLGNLLESDILCRRYKSLYEGHGSRSIWTNGSFICFFCDSVEITNPLKFLLSLI